MSTIHWSSTAGGDFSNKGDWAGGAVPGASDDAMIDAAGAYAVTVTTAEAVHSLTLNDAGATLSINNAGTLTLGSALTVTAGTVQLNGGGEISGGVLSATGGAFQWAGGIVDGLTYQGTLDMSATYATLYVTSNGMVLQGAGGAGKGGIELTGFGAALNLEGSQTLDNAKIDIGNGSYHSVLDEYDVGSKGGQVLILGSGLTINHTGAAAEITGSSTAGDEVLNKGTINASLSGGGLLIDPLTLVNQGLIAVSGGDTVTLKPTSFDDSAGSMTVDKTSTLSIQVNLTTAQLGSVTSTGLVALNTATLTNTGKVLSVGTGANLGSLTLQTNGQISGGTIADGGSGLLGAGGIVDGVTYQGTLDMSATYATLYVTSNGMVLQGAGGAGKGGIELTGFGAALNLEGSQTLDNAKIDIGNGSYHSVLDEYDVGSKGGQVLILGSGLTINHTGAAAEITGSSTAGDEVLNKGTINASLSGGGLLIDPLTLVNQGLIAVSGGDTVTLKPTSFDDSAGSMTVDKTSTLSIQVNLTTAQLGSVTSTGLVALNTATLTNTGKVLSVGTGANLGSLTLQTNGQISGGTIADGGSGLLGAGGIVDGLTYQGTLDMSATYATLYVTSNGMVLQGAGGAGKGGIELTGFGAALNLEGSQTLDNAKIDIGNGSYHSVLDEYDVGSKGGQVLILGSGLTINHTGAAAEITGSSTAGDEVLNKGTINASLSGGGLLIDPLTLVNQGLIAVSGGDTVTLKPTSFDDSAGSMTVDKTSTLSIQVNLTTAQLGSVTSTGLVALNTATLTNTGKVLSVGTGANLGSLTLQTNGQISGGTIADGGSGLLGAGGIVDGVTYQGTLDMSATYATLYVTSNGMVLQGAGGAGKGGIELTGFGAALNLEGSQTLDNAKIDIGNGSYHSVLDEYDVGSKGGQVLILGSGLTINHTGAAAQITGSSTAGDEVLNKGTINASLSGGGLLIDPLTLVNQGLIAVSGGDTVTLKPTSFDDSAGSMTVDKTSTLSIQVNLTTAQLGSVTSTGLVALNTATLTNTGKVLSVGTGANLGSLTLQTNGQISGGTIADGGSGLLGAGGIVDGVTYQGTLDMSATYATLYVTSNGMVLQGAGGAGKGGIELTGFGAALNLEGSQTLDNAKIDIGNGSYHSVLDEYDVGSKGGQVLILGSGLTINHTGAAAQITGSSTAGDEVLNKGTINASLSGGGLLIDPLTLVNQGLIAVSGGDTVVASTILNSAVGTLSVGTGSVFDLTNAAVLEIQGSLVNAGTIRIQSGGKATDLRVLAKGLTLSGGGTVTLSGPAGRILGQSTAATLTNVDNTIDGVGYLGASVLTLVNEAAGVIEATGRDLSVRTTGKTLINSGLMEAASGGRLIIVSTTLDQSGGGTITALGGGRVDLEAAIVEGGHLMGTGDLYATFTGSILDGRASAVTLSGALSILSGANLTIEGAISNTGKLDLAANASNADLVIGAAGATLSGHGQVNLDNRTLNRIYGVSSAATLTNVDNRIDGGGVLGKGQLTLVNEAAGAIVGNSPAGLVIDTGASTIANAGDIEAIIGTVTLKSAVANTGALLAAGGTLILDGAVSGAGTGIITGGILDAGAAFSENVAFAGTTGILELAHSQAYAGKVSGFSMTGGTSFDLLDIGDNDGKALASYKDNGKKTGGVLTVSDTLGHTATINLSGNYSTSKFTTSSDSHNGTTIVAQAGGAAFSSAMASFATTASAPLVGGGVGAETLPHMIAVPCARGPRAAEA